VIVQTSRRILAVSRRSRWRMRAAKGDGEDQWADFRHPARSFPIAPAPVAQQIEVTAAHEIEARTHQADRAVSEVVRLPSWARGHARRAEQHARDVAIRFAGEAPVERPQGQDKPSTLVLRKTTRRMSPRAADRKAPQAGGSFSSCDEVSVEWNDDRCRCSSARTADEHRRQATIGIVDEPVLVLTIASRD
jgi:hypothetical protein